VTPQVKEKEVKCYQVWIPGKREGMKEGVLIIRTASNQSSIQHEFLSTREKCPWFLHCFVFVSIVSSWFLTSKPKA
jgi:hypothetical protein